jgi:lambda repressor-like predicted transcriptional regulator
VPTRYNLLTKAQVTEAAALYRQGWSLARLAARLQVSHHTVRRNLAKAGVTIRPRPGQ